MNEMKKEKLMNKEKLRAFIPLFGVIICFLICVAFMIASHEKVHQQIYRKYGIDSETSYIFKFPSPTNTPNSTQYKENCDDSCILAHNINDSVGYHIGPFFLLFGSAVIIIISQICRIEYNRENNLNKKNFTKTMKQEEERCPNCGTKILKGDGYRVICPNCGVIEDKTESCEDDVGYVY